MAASSAELIADSSATNRSLRIDDSSAARTDLAEAAELPPSRGGRFARRPCPIRFGLIASARQLHFSLGRGTEVRCVEIIFSGNTDQREQGIASGIGECRSHSLRRDYIGDGTHGPFRGDPFAGRVSKHSCQTKKAGIFIDRGCLDGRNLMPAKALANNVKTARQRGVAEGSVSLAREGGADRRNKRLLWISEFRLRLGKRCRDGAD